MSEKNETTQADESVDSVEFSVVIDDIDADTAAAKADDTAATPADTPDHEVAHADAATSTSSRIDRELRGRRHVALKAYPAFAFNNIILKNRKTGRNVLDNISFDCYNGRTVAIMVDPEDPEQRVGFMAVASGMLYPTSGRVMLKSNDLASFDPSEARAHRLGVVPQQYAIRDDLDAIGNLVYTMDASGRNFLRSKVDIARNLLYQTGFGDGSEQAVENYEALVHTPAGKLREIDRRRLAIARAICCEAQILLLDEPTGGLEAGDDSSILTLLTQLARPNRKTADTGRCVIIVTDSEDVADRCDDVFALYD